MVDHPRAVESSFGVGISVEIESSVGVGSSVKVEGSVGVESNVDHTRVHRFRCRNVVVYCAKLLGIWAGNRRVCTSAKESCYLLGRRLGCTVWRDIRSWHFRSAVRGVDTGRTLPRHTALRVRMAHGLFPHSHRLATWHFCLSLELDHGGTLQCAAALCVKSVQGFRCDCSLAFSSTRSHVPRAKPS
jgi:hypothetical protein